MERSGRSGSSARASVGAAARIVRSAVVRTIPERRKQPKERASSDQPAPRCVPMHNTSRC